MSNTEEQYLKIISKCRDIFLKKDEDYGSSWTIMRTSSFTDQILIKAKRIRNIQETNQNIIGDSQEDEFGGIINYCIMAMIVASEAPNTNSNLKSSQLIDWHKYYSDETFDLMKKKNTDYGEVWRDMRVSSMTDLILAKLLRIKQIEDNAGKTKVSEGSDANYQDIINYAIFALIRL
jgi:hypothetical protein